MPAQADDGEDGETPRGNPTWLLERRGHGDRED